MPNRTMVSIALHSICLVGKISTKTFALQVKEDISNGNMKEIPIIVNKWFPGGILNFIHPVKPD